MPLTILVALVVGGIAGIAGLTWALGWARRLTFSDPLDASEAWTKHFPDIPSRGATLSADRNAALVETHEGPGIIWSFGADTCARLLDKADVLPHPQGLLIRLHDFGAPEVIVHLDATQAATPWRALLNDHQSELQFDQTRGTA